MRANFIMEPVRKSFCSFIPDNDSPDGIVVTFREGKRFNIIGDMYARLSCFVGFDKPDSFLIK